MACFNTLIVGNMVFVRCLTMYEKKWNEQGEFVSFGDIVMHAMTHQSSLFFFFCFATMRVMRYLGIDYGARRIGMAVADDEVGIATPHCIIQRGNDAQAAGEIMVIVRQERIGKVVIGLPLAHDGVETDESREVRAFAGEPGPHDDMTLILLKVEPAGSTTVATAVAEVAVL